MSFLKNGLRIIKLEMLWKTLGLDWKLLLAQIVNFTILFFILKKVLFKPLMKMIDDRNKKIEDAVDNSKAIEERLVKIDEKEKNVIEGAKDKGREERESIIETANLEKGKIIEEAKLLAHKEIAKGLESIESAKKEAIKNLSDDYLQKVTSNLYSKLKKESKSGGYPALKSLLRKNER